MNDRGGLGLENSTPTANTLNKNTHLLWHCFDLSDAFVDEFFVGDAIGAHIEERAKVI